MTEAQPTDDTTIARLQKSIETVLSQVIFPGKCALVDFPKHSNVGDSAIWLGEVQHLHDRGFEIVYTCDVTNYRSGRLRRTLPSSGTIFLHGGGNLGDLWPTHQALRERVIEDFPDRRIVQLPQSMEFRSEANLSRAKSVFEAHPDLTLLLRDQPNYEKALASFDVPLVLCPDMALLLGKLSRPSPPSCPIAWLARQDIEQRPGSCPPSQPDVRVFDWLQTASTPQQQSLQRFAHRLSKNVLYGLDPLCASVRRKSHLQLSLHHATSHVTRGISLLSAGRVVVTDRLHGHLLSLLLNIPHVVLDDMYGKCRAFYDSWTKDSCLVHWAVDPAEAIRLASLLAKPLEKGSSQ